MAIQVSNGSAGANLQTKLVSTITGEPYWICPDAGYDGFSAVQIPRFLVNIQTVKGTSGTVTFNQTSSSSSSLQGTIQGKFPQLEETSYFIYIYGAPYNENDNIQGFFSLIYYISYSPYS